MEYHLMKRNAHRLFLIGLAFVFVACGKKEVGKPTLFSKIPSDQSKVSFRNDLTYDAKFNIYRIGIFIMEAVLR